MKIWIKISLLVFIVANLAIEGILFFIRDEFKKVIINSTGEKLQSIAVSISSSIDGDKYELLKFNSKDVDNDPYYKYIKNLLVETKDKLKLNEEIYTLNLIDTTKAVFGVMTNNIPFPGDTLHLTSKTEKRMLVNSFMKKEGMRSGIYDDQYGMWISGMAPIINSKNKVVGVIQVDHESSLVLAKIDELYNKIFYFQLILIPLITIISIAFSKLITNPVSKLIKLVESISNGNYEEPKPIKAYGEIKNLVKSTNLMRETFLEQQQKIFETINSLKVNNKELVIAKEKAEEMTRLKNNFLANISHELRTPLIGALGFTEILYDETTSPENKEMLKDILTSLQRLMKTLNSLIELSELESRKIEIVLSEIEVCGLINETISIYAGNANSKGLYLQKKIPPKKLYIKSDRQLLHQVINNLVDNAIKFTEKGGVIISVNGLNGSGNKKLEIKIEDTGIGIPGDCYNIIFSEFRQASEGLSRNFEGIGLGLPLSKRYIELLGGRILLNSKVNSGSVFTIELPIT